MDKVLIAELVTVIAKNGGIEYNTVIGGGILSVQQNTEKPNTFSLWFIPPWAEVTDSENMLNEEGRPSPYDTRPMPAAPVDYGGGLE